MKQGKISRTFQELNDGDRVCLVRDKTEQEVFPKRMQGKSGVIAGKRGESYIVKVKDLKKEKTYIVKPIHLRKLK